MFFVPGRCSGRTLARAGVCLAVSIAAVVPLVADALPVVVSSHPADQAVGVPLDGEVRVEFLSALDPKTVRRDNVLVTSNLRGEVPGTVSWLGASNEILFRPSRSFLPNERILVTLTTDLTDLVPESLPHGHHFQFTTWVKPVPYGAFVAADSSWQIGSIALNMTPVDLDGDGRPEAVFSNGVPDSLTILTPDADATNWSIYAQLETNILPRHTVAADLNRDGRPDLVCCASGPNLVDVFLNDGAGGFLPRASYPTGQTPYGAFAADFDADGDIDVATANFNSQNVSVLLNDGTGAFVAPVHYPAGVLADSPRYVDGADFDGDGDVDLACCNGYSSDVSVFLNDGDGTFQVQGPRPQVGGSPNFMECRDFDGDGIVDIVTVNASLGNLSFVPGVGDGTFGPVETYPVEGTLAYGIAVGDVDGDLDLDVTVPVRGSNTWQTMWNDGSGVFTAGTPYTAGTHCHTIGVADWDGDLDLDVVAGFAISKDMYFFRQSEPPRVIATNPPGNSTGVSKTASIDVYFSTDLDPGSATETAYVLEGSQSGRHPIDVAWDAGEQKMVLTPLTEGFAAGEIVTVTVTGTGTIVSQDGLPYDGYSFEFMTESAPSPVTFEVTSIPLPGDDPVNLDAADLDGDGASDLVVVNFVSGDITLLLTAGDGLPAVASTVPVGGGPLDVWSGDLDGDGFTDLATANLISTSVSILRNTGGGSFQAIPSIGAVGAPFAIAGGDYDLDGDMDLAVAEIDPARLSIHWNDGAAGFPSRVELPVAGTPLDLAVADIDRDGDLDLVAVDAGNNQIEVFLYGSNGFVPAGTYPTGGTPVSTFPWDTNGDGWIDLVSADYGNGGISVLENLGDGMSFAPAFALPSNAQPHGLWAADLDGDGMIELVTANSGAAEVSVFTNLGNGEFDAGTSLAVGSTPYAVAGGDWNGDERVDLAVVNRTSGDLSFLLNGAATVAPPIGPPSRATALVGVAPNPFQESIAVDFHIARSGEARLRVFDLAGRNVATLSDGTYSPGLHRVRWDGRDGAGRRVAAGVYFLRLEAEGHGWSRKVLRIR